MHKVILDHAKVATMVSSIPMLHLVRPIASVLDLAHHAVDLSDASAGLMRSCVPKDTAGPSLIH